MKRLQALRPSPAMVVALVALFAALGGSAYAATKIGTNQIQNGAITAAKIKKNGVTGAKISSNAVTSAKIADGAVTGAKINMSTLGTVPSATHSASADTAGNADFADTAAKANTATTATTAGRADEATTADKAKEATTAETATTATDALNFSRYKSTGIVKAAVGQEVTVWTSGPFTATGICEEVGPLEFEALTLLTTSAAGSSAASEDSQYERADFEPGDSLAIGELIVSTEPRLNEQGDGNYYEGFTAVSPDGGTLLNGISVSAVHYFGADCAFFAEMTNAG